MTIAAADLIKNDQAHLIHPQHHSSEAAEPPPKEISRHCDATELRREIVLPPARPPQFLRSEQAEKVEKLPGAADHDVGALGKSRRRLG